MANEHRDAHQDFTDWLTFLSVLGLDWAEEPSEYAFRNGLAGSARTGQRPYGTSSSCEHASFPPSRRVERRADARVRAPRRSRFRLRRARDSWTRGRRKTWWSRKSGEGGLRRPLRVRWVLVRASRGLAAGIYGVGEQDRAVAPRGCREDAGQKRHTSILFERRARAWRCTRTGPAGGRRPHDHAAGIPARSSRACEVHGPPAVASREKRGRRYTVALCSKAQAACVALLHGHSAAGALGGAGRTRDGRGTACVWRGRIRRARDARAGAQSVRTQRMRNVCTTAMALYTVHAMVLNSHWQKHESVKTRPRVPLCRLPALCLAGPRRRPSCPRKTINLASRHSPPRPAPR